MAIQELDGILLVGVISLNGGAEGREGGCAGRRGAVVYPLGHTEGDFVAWNLDEGES